MEKRDKEEMSRRKFPEEIIKGDNITESGFNYEEEYEKRVYKRCGWILLM